MVVLALRLHWIRKISKTSAKSREQKGHEDEPDEVSGIMIQQTAIACTTKMAASQTLVPQREAEVSGQL